MSGKCGSRLQVSSLSLPACLSLVPCCLEYGQVVVPSGPFDVAPIASGVEPSGFVVAHASCDGLASLVSMVSSPGSYFVLRAIRHEVPSSEGLSAIDCCHHVDPSAAGAFAPWRCWRAPYFFLALKKVTWQRSQCRVFPVLEASSAGKCDLTWQVCCTRGTCWQPRKVASVAI